MSARLSIASNSQDFSFEEFVQSGERCRSIVVVVPRTLAWRGPSCDGVGKFWAHWELGMWGNCSYQVGVVWAAGGAKCFFRQVRQWVSSIATAPISKGEPRNDVRVAYQVPRVVALGDRNMEQLGSHVYDHHSIFGEPKSLLAPYMGFL